MNAECATSTGKNTPYKKIGTEKDSLTRTLSFANPYATHACLCLHLRADFPTTKGIKDISFIQFARLFVYFLCMPRLNWT